MLYGSHLWELFFDIIFFIITFLTLSTLISLPHIDNASFRQHKQMHTSDCTNECTYETHVQNFKRSFSNIDYRALSAFTWRVVIVLSVLSIFI